MGAGRDPLLHRYIDKMDYSYSHAAEPRNQLHYTTGGLLPHLRNS